MKKIFLLLFCCVFLLPVSGRTVPNLLKSVNPLEMNHWVDSVFNSMTDDEKIGQLLMMVVSPKIESRNMQKAYRYVQELNVGGILFQKGLPEHQAEITNRLQKAARIPLMIALDGEWGLSMRLTGTTRFPKNMMLGAVENDSLLEAYGAEVARQCKEMGIHVNFAPDMDVNSNVDNPVIGLRSYGESPLVVGAKGVAYAKGLEENGVIAVAKHFPGHGDTDADSHYTLPMIGRDRNQLDKVELPPFRQFINAGFAGMMIAHLYVPALDKTKNRPVSMSPAVVTDLLKKDLGFEGLCFTDALEMKGAAADNSSVKALLAGNDFLLSPARPEIAVQEIKKAISDGVLKKKDIESKVLKILRYKFVAGLNHYKPLQVKGMTERLNTPYADWLAARLNAEAITLLKNEDKLLPLRALATRKMAVLSIGEENGNEFQKMLNRYDTLACFSITRRTSAQKVQQVFKKLQDYDVIICGVNTVRIPEFSALRELAQEKELIYAFFTLPYFCREYKASIGKAKALVMGYESTPMAQRFAAQAIMGGIAMKGKLPVSIPGLYFAGTGLFTHKTRLGYHYPDEVKMNTIRLAEIDTIVNEGLKAKAYPGCQVLVAKDGWIVYNKCFGHTTFDKTQPVTEDLLYDLASSSKATGTLLSVMKAYDEKKFTLQDKISQFLPELDDSNKKDITIKELLYHQSGVVPSINFYMDAIDGDSYKGTLFRSGRDAHHPVCVGGNTYARTDYSFYPECVSSTSKPGFTKQVAKDMYVSDQFNDSIIRDIKESRLGPKKYRYSCVNFIMLKMMVERVMHQPMDELLDINFFAALGAWHTLYNPLHRFDVSRVAPTEEDGFVRRQLLQGYVHDEAAAFQGGVSGNAGLFSNANDLAKIMQLYLQQGVYGGERYLSKSTCRLFTESKSPTCHRGLGFDKPYTENPKYSNCGMLAPISVYGHTGFTGTCFWIDPDNGLLYVFLSNRVYPTRNNNKLGRMDIRTRIHDVIYKSLENK